MKPGLLLLLATILAGCAERWTRPGATEADVARAMTQCRGIAAREIPTNMVRVQVSPSRYEPPRRTCRTYGRNTYCNTTPARFTPAQYDWRDMNAGQRNAVRRGCMAERGFTYEGDVFVSPF